MAELLLSAPAGIVLAAPAQQRFACLADRSIHSPYTAGRPSSRFSRMTTLSIAGLPCLRQGVLELADDVRAPLHSAPVAPGCAQQHLLELDVDLGGEGCHLLPHCRLVAVGAGPAWR